MTKLIFQPIFDDETMQDRQVMHVPMMMMDAAAPDKRPVFDTRPKAVIDADETVRRTARQAAYDARVGDAWKGATDTASPPVAATRQAHLIQAYDKRITEAWRDPK